MENNLLQFPQKKSLKKRLFDRDREKRSMIALSLASVFLVTLVLNEVIRDVHEATRGEGQRQMASVNARDQKVEMAWEHEWARKLASSEVSAQGESARKPTLQDELLYGILEGLYNVQFANGKIVSLELNAARSGSDQHSVDPLMLLTKYREFFAEGLESVHPVSSVDQTNIQVFDLLGNSKKVLGQAHIEMNSQGFIQKLTIKSM